MLDCVFAGWGEHSDTRMALCWTRSEHKSGTHWYCV